MGPPGAPGAPPAGPPPAQPSGPFYTDVQCEIEPAPKAGGVQGSAQSAAGGTLAGVQVELIDVNGGVHNATTGPDGSFGFKDLPLGDAKIKATHEEYMIHVTLTTVRPKEDVKVLLTLNPRPKQKTVRIVGNQLQVLKKIHFELNSAVIKGDSFQLMEEIADVLQRNPDLKKVEVQGHTDNTGTVQINTKLSQDRAESVRNWLVEHGVAADRLDAKGYGATRPLAPNVTPANRERNRRVQFVITERAGAPAPKK
jgi:outer membrane protein OmpA-like peptidoglycan-associated protein